MNLVYVSRLFSIMHYTCVFFCVVGWFCVYFVFVVVLFSFLCIISTSISLLLPPLPLLNTSYSLILYVVYLRLSLPWLAAVCPNSSNYKIARDAQLDVETQTFSCYPQGEALLKSELGSHRSLGFLCFSFVPGILPFLGVILWNWNVIITECSFKKRKI